MAENKKSVLLYCDIIHTVEELDDVDAGLLFKHYLRYINDQNPEPPSKLIKIVFEPIKQNLKRDLVKWVKKSERNSEIAIAGWEKRKNANASERIESNANHADKEKVIVTVNDKVNGNVNESEKKETPSAGLKKNFDWWWSQIKSDEIWLSNVKSTHNGKDIEGAAREAHLSLMSNELRLYNTDLSGFKGYVNSWLSNKKQDDRTGNKKQASGTRNNFSGNYKEDL